MFRKCFASGAGWADRVGGCRDWCMHAAGGQHLAERGQACFGAPALGAAMQRRLPGWPPGILSCQLLLLAGASGSTTPASLPALLCLLRHAAHHVPCCPPFSRPQAPSSGTAIKVTEAAPETKKKSSCCQSG